MMREGYVFTGVCLCAGGGGKVYGSRFLPWFLVSGPFQGRGVPLVLSLILCMVLSCGNPRQDRYPPNQDRVPSPRLGKATVFAVRLFRSRRRTFLFFMIYPKNSMLLFEIHTTIYSKYNLVYCT